MKVLPWQLIFAISIFGMHIQAMEQQSLGRKDASSNTKPAGISGSVTSSSESLRGSSKENMLNKYFLFLFDSKLLPIRRYDMFPDGSAKETKLRESLSESAIDYFIFITSNNLNTLDDECNNNVTKVIKGLKIEIDTISCPETVDKFILLMKKYSELLTPHLASEISGNFNDMETPLTREKIAAVVNKVHNKSIGLFGMSNNKVVFEFLTYWTITVLINDAWKRDYEFLIDDQQYPLSILMTNDKGQKVIAEQIVRRAYKRVFGNRARRQQLLTDKDEEMIQLYCLSEIKRLKNPNVEIRIKK